MSAFLVAGSAAYFSVLGIATLFSGSFYQVVVMAGALEFGKLVATSYLYRYWNQTVWWLKTYLITAVVVLMAITSIGIFGYLSAAYQQNSAKFSQVESQIQMIETQKNVFSVELEQNNKRIEMLNQVRITQEQRVQEAGNYRLPREQAYAAIDKANQELQQIVERNKIIQEEKAKKDQEILTLNQQFNQVKDIGTFKFVADVINKPLDKVVVVFIFILICVFDPLAVSLVLAFNVATRGKIVKEDIVEENVVEEVTPIIEEIQEEQAPIHGAVFKGLSASAKLKKRV